MNDLDVVILAAGKGTRMRSARPKVLHELGGKPLIEHVLSAASRLGPRTVAVVVGHESDAVRAGVDRDVIWVEQTEQLGTGHAVQQALPSLPGDGNVLVLYADVPLIDVETLQTAVAAAAAGSVGVVTAMFEDPGALGRIVRNGSGHIERIVEYKDADEATRAIQEINSGIMAIPAAKLGGWLDQVEPNNSQGEYYLTDVVDLAVRDGVNVEGISARCPEEVAGVNDRVELGELERHYQRNLATTLMNSGVTIADPDRIDIRGELVTGQDCFIDINVVIEGRVELGNGVHIGPGAVLIDSAFADNVEVKAHTVVEGATLGEGAAVGPFARIRPGSVLESGVKIGNFVETKKAHIGKDTKAGHLAYLGDTTIGEDCNIGAGSVTCNYDGVDKHSTSIGDNVFVGTNTTLVAPINIGDDAFVAAGSTVTTKVQDGDLAVGRGKQRNIKGWVPPARRKPKDK